MYRPLALVFCLAAAAACSKKKEEAPATAAGPAGAGSAEGSNASERVVRKVQPTPAKRAPGSTETEPPGLPGAGSGSAAGTSTAREKRTPLDSRDMFFDRDGDGQLSDQERRSMQLARSNALLRRLDGDHDNKVSKAELEGSRFRGFLTSFEAADADKDGSLSHAEIGAAMEQASKTRAALRGRSRPGAGSGATPP